MAMRQTKLGDLELTRALILTHVVALTMVFLKVFPTREADCHVHVLDVHVADNRQRILFGKLSFYVNMNNILG